MPEELVMERFRLLERIGSGGMGTVYRAFDERLQRDVAVKEVEVADPERVLREAQAAARLNHPAIVTLYELGERAGRAMLVSELVPGTTLAQLKSSGELSDREVGELGADLCDALAHAHARGVVHRDLKPHNIVVRDEDGAGRRAKLMDFGIARIAGAPTLTAAGEVVGTLAYMSPEQADGLVAGPASDVYSLALTLYECWTGENPVAGRTPAETARRIGAQVPSLREHRPDLPEGLADLIDACLDPDPDLRPTPFELRECIEAELIALDPERAVPMPHADEERPRRQLRLVGILALLGFIALLLLAAGPFGAGGLALVIGLLTTPALLIAGPVGLVTAAAPLAGALGIAAAAPAAAAFAVRPVERAVLGAVAWAWLLTGALAFGAGSRLGIAAPAPERWLESPGVATDSLLAPLLTLDAGLGAALFALAAVVLGRLLASRHLAIAALGALGWAACLDAGLRLVGDGGLGGHPLAAAAVAAAAVVLEFGVIRGDDRDRWGDPEPGRGALARVAPTSLT